jgi:DNA adenine methylase
MVKYSCEKCGKDFGQKSHYDQHMRRKNPCVHENKLKEMIANVIKESNLEPSVILPENVEEDKNQDYFSNGSDVLNVEPIVNEVIEMENNMSLDYAKEKSLPYLEKYLAFLEKKDGSGFKRVIVSPLRYAGGKSKAVGLILEFLPKLKNKRIVSPFFGGGSFELAVAQNLQIEVIGYDIFGMLTNFWNVLIHQKNEFITELQKFEVTTEEFTRNRHILLSYWDTIKPSTLKYKTMKPLELTEEEKARLPNNEVLQAVYYYYNMSLSYGPMFLGWPSSNEIKKDKFDRRIEFLEKMNINNVSVHCCDFKTAIKNHPDDFLFLDPPYYLGTDSKMFKGMYPNCNFAIHHNGFEHDILCELLKNHKGGFLITYNNCETIRDWYKDYNQVFPEWQYTYGQGEKRIGKNRTENGTNSNVKESHEIFIISPPIL